MISEITSRELGIIIKEGYKQAELASKARALELEGKIKRDPKV